MRHAHGWLNKMGWHTVPPTTAVSFKRSPHIAAVEPQAGSARFPLWSRRHAMNREGTARNPVSNNLSYSHRISTRFACTRAGSHARDVMRNARGSRHSSKGHTARCTLPIHNALLGRDPVARGCRQLVCTRRTSNIGATQQKRQGRAEGWGSDEQQCWARVASTAARMEVR